MANDPYKTLGVAKTATPKEIQSAYRKLAKKLHPDLNPGDKSAEDRFKTVSEAYSILGDEDKRARFDKGEIDGAGTEQAPRNYYREYAGAPGGDARYQNSSGFSDFTDTDDIFSSFFSRRGPMRAKGRDPAILHGGEFPRCGQRLEGKDHAAGWSRARSAGAAGHAGRPDAAAARQG